MSDNKKTVVIIQSNYIPWKGYFDLINSADEFVIYDHVQYTKGDWRNRNKINTPQGFQWLTIPVDARIKKNPSIQEVTVNARGANWNKKHWRTIQLNYSKAPAFKQYGPILEQLYLEELGDIKYLSQINRLLIEKINELLKIDTRVSWSSDYELKGDKTGCLVNLCNDLEATHYLSGPAAKNYLDEKAFNEEGITVEWMDYSGYPEYNQLFNHEFQHGVTILDLLFNVGEEARTHFKSANKS